MLRNVSTIKPMSIEKGKYFHNSFLFFSFVILIHSMYVGLPLLCNNIHH